MDHRSFDRLARILGGASDRRTGLKALVGGLLGAGTLAALDADADAKRTGRGKDRGPDAGRRRKKKKKCDPACEVGFACVKGRCTCASGIACSGACCGSGQVCRDGACADPLPACLAFGAECKDTGRRCCDGLTCASGQDGSYPVTCLKAKGASCERTAECPFGMTCTDGRCLGGGGDSLPTGAACSGGETCAQPGATCSAYTTAGAPAGEFCTLPLRKVCIGNPDCSCYNCWYVQPGVVVNGRESRAEAPVKACIQPKNAACTTTADCALGLTCQNSICSGSGEQCAPGGAPCGGSVACCEGGCTGGFCPGGGSSCTVTATGNPTADGAALKTAVESASDGAVITVGPGTYKPVPTGSPAAALVITKNITIQACDPTNKPTVDGGATVTKTSDGGAPGETDNAKSLTWADGNRIIVIGGNKTVTIDGINLTRGNTPNVENVDYDEYGGAILAVGAVTLTVKNLDISLSKSVEDGGGLFVEGDGSTTSQKLTIQNVNVTQCLSSSGYGGGIGAYKIPTEITGTATLKSKVMYNASTNTCGGIYYSANFTDDQLAAFGNTTLTIQHVQVSNNYTDYYGGGLYLEELGGKASASLSDLDVTGNTAYYDAGGILLNFGSVSTTAKASLANVIVQYNIVEYTSSSINYGAAGGVLNTGRMDLGGGVDISGNKAKYGSGVKNGGPTAYVTCTGTPGGGKTYWVSGNTNVAGTTPVNGDNYADCYGGLSYNNTATPANRMPLSCCATQAPACATVICGGACCANSGSCGGGGTTCPS